MPGRDDPRPDGTAFGLTRDTVDQLVESGALTRAEADAAYPPAGEWPCEAYGPDGLELGALCFFADPGTRNCATAGECAVSMRAARQLAFGRIQAGAARGDPDMIYLASQFTSPDQILGGGDTG